MKKKLVALVIAFSFVISGSAISFADENNYQNAENYEINTVKELKTEINENASDNENAPLSKSDQKYIEENTDPMVIKEFIDEKDALVDEILEENVIIIDEDDNYFQETYDLGDNCWLEIVVSEQEEIGLLEAMKNEIVPSVYAVSKSGYKTGWQSYAGGKKYSYKAQATVNYAVASGAYTLKVYYKLTADGITIYDEIASADDSGLLNASVVKETISDSKATLPGESDCDAYATYKTTYGYDPIEWSKSHIMRVKIKYLSKDTVDKEIQNTRQWTFKNL